MSRYEQDLRLVDAILAGTLAAWHGFVDRYSGLLYATLRKYLRAEDEDEIRSAYVDLLHDLYHGKLAGFEGRSTLSTWLVLVARHAACDRLRRLYGRGRAPVGWKALDPLARAVHRLYVVEGLRFEFVRRLARPEGPPLAEEELLEVLARLRASRSLRRRLPPRRSPGSGGICGSPRIPVQEYTWYLQQLSAETADDRDPQAILARQEAMRVQSRLARELRRLPAVERQVLYLRFWRGMTARDIAVRLGLARERQAYSSIDRALRKLRVAFEKE